MRSVESWNSDYSRIPTPHSPLAYRSTDAKPQLAMMTSAPGVMSRILRAISTCSLLVALPSFFLRWVSFSRRLRRRLISFLRSLMDMWKGVGGQGTGVRDKPLDPMLFWNAPLYQPGYGRST